LRRERFSGRRAVALAAATAGIALALTGGGTGVIDPVGVGLALTSSLIYALYVLASSSLLGTTDSLVLAASVATGAAITFFADAAVHGQLAPRGGLIGIGLVVAVALSSSVLGTSAFLAGVRQLGASRASIVSSAEPALTAAFAFAAFGDRFGPVQLLGAGLVLASVPIIELKRTPPSSRRKAWQPASSGSHHPLHHDHTEKGTDDGHLSRRQTESGRHHTQPARPHVRAATARRH
jgi:drug/metabolite transporter (DMT)-like permease